MMEWDSSFRTRSGRDGIREATEWAQFIRKSERVFRVSKVQSGAGNLGDK